MRNLDDLRVLDAMGRVYGVRPSTILGIADEWAAYQLDIAALIAGGQPEGKSAPDGRTTIFVNQAARQPAAPAPRGFKDPAMYIKRMIRIPESGVW